MLASQQVGLDWVKQLPQTDSFETLKSLLIEKLSQSSSRLARLPELLKINTRPQFRLEELQEIFPDRQAWFRTNTPPDGICSALLPVADGWSLVVSEHLAEELVCQQLLRACLHLWLGHLRSDDQYGIWMDSQVERRWDREVASYLPSPKDAVIPLNVWAAARFLKYLPWGSVDVPVAADLLGLKITDHQARVAKQLSARFPERFIVCQSDADSRIIQVGLGLRELRLKKMADRILVVVRPGRAAKWQELLQTHFGLEFEIRTISGLNDAPQSVIVELASIAETLSIATDSACFDLLVVDSAEFNGEGPAIRALCRHSRSVWLTCGAPWELSADQHFRNLDLCGLRGEFATQAQFCRYFELLDEAPTLQMFENLSPYAISFLEEYQELGLCRSADEYWKSRFDAPIPSRMARCLTQPTAETFNDLTAEQRDALSGVLLRQSPFEQSLFWEESPDRESAEPSKQDSALQRLFAGRSNPPALAGVVPCGLYDLHGKDPAVTRDSLLDTFIQGGIVTPTEEDPRIVFLADGSRVTFHPELANSSAIAPSLILYGSPLFESLLQVLLRRPVKGGLGVCALTATAGPFLIGEIRFWENGRWQKLRSLQECLEILDGLSDEGLPSPTSVQSALEAALENHARREQRLQTVLLGRDQAAAAALLVRGFAIRDCVGARAVGRPPKCGILGVLIAAEQPSLAQSEFERLSEILGATIYAYSLQESDYQSFNEASTDQLSEMLQAWMVEARTWLDERHSLPLCPEHFSVPVTACALRPGEDVSS